MCELLGMNCNVPTDIQFSFRGFRQRGGSTAPHADGWGVAFYEERGCRLFHDDAPCARSPFAQLLEQLPIKSRNVVAHIRRARTGRVCIENTHPFHRELWGRTWVFAHNGQLQGVKRKPVSDYLPIGTTDSEHAFCHMLSRIRRELPANASYRSIARLVRDTATGLATLGEFNFLLCDGRRLFAFCTKKLVFIERRAPFARAALADDDFEIDFNDVTRPDDRVVVVATRPLTHNEVWTPIRSGELRVFADGVSVHTLG